MSQPPLPRLSVRRGLAVDSAYEGVPSHLLIPLQRWARSYLGQDGCTKSDSERDACLMRLAIICRVEVEDERFYLTDLVDLADDAYGGAERFLDVVDMHLQLFSAGSDVLEAMLRDGGSVWMVTEAPCRLTQRVPDEEYDLFMSAATPADEASAALQEAWAKVYGRTPDPSDAWDHAIKAVEILLHPIVSPANDKATLGSMLAALEDKPGKWTLTLATSSTKVPAVEALTGMLRLMWVNPDRHGSGSGSSRVPTQDEAEQVVRLAVFVVGWLRTGAMQPAAPAIGAAGSP